MKEKWMPHIIAVNALVVFIVLGLACASEPEPNRYPKERQTDYQENQTDYQENQTDNSESDFRIDWDPNTKDGVMITSYNGTRRVVRIPSSIQNNPVTAIGSNVFTEKFITSITIPNSVTSVRTPLLTSTLWYSLLL